ncbi:MAG: hypothetical protein HYZ58_19540 [Acidobacteria bacterium]|nr:hypothetical protein [Acidobacteriota bacterium]MBI3265329.1 hypothetical protein [Acidobacteriota bacterium]
MKPGDLLELLTGFYRDKLVLVARHEVSATRVSEYDVNNTYQYILAREDAQLAWVRAAIQEFDGQLPERVAAIQVPSSARQGPREGRSAESLSNDAADAEAFVAHWRPRVDAMTHARHKGMLAVILGETLEHKRFFEQALGGRTDLLGRRAEGAGTGGGVLPTRWLE